MAVRAVRVSRGALAPDCSHPALAVGSQLLGPDIPQGRQKSQAAGPVLDDVRVTSSSDVPSPSRLLLAQAGDGIGLNLTYALRSASGFSASYWPPLTLLRTASFPHYGFANLRGYAPLGLAFYGSKLQLLKSSCAALPCVFSAITTSPWGPRVTVVRSQPGSKLAGSRVCLVHV